MEHLNPGVTKTWGEISCLFYLSIDLAQSRMYDYKRLNSRVLEIYQKLCLNLDKIVKFEIHFVYLIGLQTRSVYTLFSKLPYIHLLEWIKGLESHKTN